MPTELEQQIPRFAEALFVLRLARSHYFRRNMNATSFKAAGKAALSSRERLSGILITAPEGTVILSDHTPFETTRTLSLVDTVLTDPPTLNTDPTPVDPATPALFLKNDNPRI